jgi:hypothetical protein
MTPTNFAVGLPPTTRARLQEITGKVEEATTDGDLSDISQNDIGDIYNWLLKWNDDRFWGEGKDDKFSAGEVK